MRQQKPHFLQEKKHLNVLNLTPILLGSAGYLNFAVNVLRSFLNSTHDATTLKITQFVRDFHTHFHSAALFFDNSDLLSIRKGMTGAHPREKHLWYVVIVTVIQREQGVQFLWRTSFFSLFISLV